MKRHRLMFMVATFLAVAVGDVLVADDPKPAIWPEWRGPTRDGFVTGSDWPDRISDGKLKVSWRLGSLGPSYSGPIVTEDRVFTTETIDKKQEVVRCLKRKTGEEIWKKDWTGSLTVPFFAARNGSWIRSTPAFDGKALYIAGIRDVLVCLEAKDGSERWRFDFTKEFKAPLPAFGFVCSPLVDDSGVYVQAGAAFVKLDKKSGTVIWKTLQDDGGMFGSAFSSPVFGKLAGRDQVLVQTRLKLAGVDREKGDVLWSRPIPADRGMNILTPVQVGDTIYTSSYGGGSRLVSLSLVNGVHSPSEAWTTKYQGYMTTPIVIDGFAYHFGRDRKFVCVDLKTGEETWRSERRFGEYWSMVAQKNKILALDASGKLYLIQANTKEFQLLDEVEVSKAETWAHLAVCGDEIFVRDLDGLTAFRWSK